MGIKRNNRDESTYDCVSVFGKGLFFFFSSKNHGNNNAGDWLGYFHLADVLILTRLKST